LQAFLSGLEPEFADELRAALDGAAAAPSTPASQASAPPVRGGDA
jgi:hypothetical protein